VSEDLAIKHAQLEGISWPIAPDYYGAGRQPEPPANYYQRIYLVPDDNKVPATPAALSLDARFARSVDPDNAPTPELVLESNLVLEFDPSRGVDGSGWTCQQSGLVLAAEGAPVFTPSDVDFVGAPSLTTNLAGAYFRAATSPVDILPAGSRPYTAWLGRVFATTAQFGDILFALAGSAGTGNNFTTFRSGTQPQDICVAHNGTVVRPRTSHTGVHLIEYMFTASGLELWVDNALLVTQSSIPSVTAAIRRVSIGGPADGVTQSAANASHAYAIACSIAPTQMQRDSLLPFWRLRGAPV